nr:M48 family metallopeptidase [Marinomonas spartinae]
MRKITLKDGSLFETQDNDAIDALLNDTITSTRLMAFIHILEKNLTFTIACIFIIIAVVFSGFKWGLPVVSNVIANNLPASANQVLSSHALQFLDATVLSASQLPSEQKLKIRQHFENKIVPLYQTDDKTVFTLHFRRWPSEKGTGIANALALPDGDIIITDRLIQLAHNEAEIDLILLHEMGHIVGRHALKKVIEGSIMAVTASLIFGDINSMNDLGIGVGSFLISNVYSRHYEAQADQFAYQHALTANIPPSSLGDILTRIEQTSNKGIPNNDLKNTKGSTKTQSDDGGFSRLLSTHPSSAQRVRIGKHYQDCFNQGLTHCPSP